MSDDVSIRLPLTTRNTFYGKCLLIVILAYFAGRWFSQDLAADYAKGSALTLEAYTAGYEAYRAGLMDTTVPTPVGVLIFGGMIGGLLAVYEVLGALLGSLIGKLLPSGEVDAVTQQANDAPLT